MLIKNDKSKSCKYWLNNEYEINKKQKSMKCWCKEGDHNDYITWPAKD